MPGSPCFITRVAFKKMVGTLTDPHRPHNWQSTTLCTFSNTWLRLQKANSARARKPLLNLGHRVIRMCSVVWNWTSWSHTKISSFIWLTVEHSTHSYPRHSLSSSGIILLSRQTLTQMMMTHSGPKKSILCCLRKSRMKNVINIAHSIMNYMM